MRAPRAFDVIGDIAIVEIPAPLVKKEKIIAEALLEVNRHMHVVVKSRDSRVFQDAEG